MDHQFFLYGKESWRNPHLLGCDGWRGRRLNAEKLAELTEGQSIYVESIERWDEIGATAAQQQQFFLDCPKALKADNPGFVPYRCGDWIIIPMGDGDYRILSEIRKRREHRCERQRNVHVSSMSDGICRE